MDGARATKNGGGIIEPTDNVNVSSAPHTPSKRQARGVVVTVLALTFSRLIVNMTRRFPYAFLPTISRQLGVSLGAVQTITALQAGVGLASPAFGPLSERYGRRRVMQAMLLFITAAGILGALVPEFWAFAVVMIAFGVAKIVFDPAMQAYLGDRIPYRRRGLAMGTAELSWAGALLFAAPLAGFLLAFSPSPTPDALIVTGQYPLLADVSPEPTGLRLVFGALALLGLVAFVVMTRLVPSDKPAGDEAREVINPLTAWGTLRRSPAALGSIGHALLLATANEIFFINYGAWMELSFGLVLAALGSVTVVIAAAEFIGEFTVMGIADRIGKRRLSLIGTVIAGVSYVILPHLDNSLPLALAGIFVMFLFVEIGIVASIPLFSEVMPEARAVMMSGVIGAASTGRFLGAALGGALLALVGDFAVIGLVSTVIGLSAAVSMWALVPEGDG